MESNIYTGTTFPLNTFGVDGDLYFDICRRLIFIKEDGIWTLSGRITAPAGAPRVSIDSLTNSGLSVTTTSAKSKSCRTGKCPTSKYSRQSICDKEYSSNSVNSTNTIYGKEAPMACLGQEGMYYVNDTTGEQFIKSRGMWVRHSKQPSSKERYNKNECKEYCNPDYNQNCKTEQNCNKICKYKNECKEYCNPDYNQNCNQICKDKNECVKIVKGGTGATGGRGPTGATGPTGDPGDDIVGATGEEGIAGLLATMDAVHTVWYHGVFKRFRGGPPPAPPQQPRVGLFGDNTRNLLTMKPTYDDSSAVFNFGAIAPIQIGKTDVLYDARITFADLTTNSRIPSPALPYVLLASVYSIGYFSVTFLGIIEFQIPTIDPTPPLPISDRLYFNNFSQRLDGTTVAVATPADKIGHDTYVASRIYRASEAIFPPPPPPTPGTWPVSPAFNNIELVPGMMVGLVFNNPTLQVPPAPPNETGPATFFVLEGEENGDVIVTTEYVYPPIALGVHTPFNTIVDGINTLALSIYTRSSLTLPPP